MKRVEIVPTNYVYHVWDRVEPFLDNGLKNSYGEYTVEQLKVLLVLGQQMLMIIVDDENTIYGAIAITFTNYPNSRIAFISAIGGKALTTKDLGEQFEMLLRQQGATAIRGAAFESVARLWKKSFGYESRYVIVEKVL